MYRYTVETDKDFAQANEALLASLKKHQFGVVGSMDIKDKLAEKGVDFAGQVRIHDVCNPRKAKEALEDSTEVAYFLPCRVVVYVEDGKTKIGTVKPSAMAGMIEGRFPQALMQEVEATMLKILDDAR
jgi:uncharacterized protein (DUF302 family)